MEIDDSLLKTISDNGANDIISEMSEVTLDSIIQNDLIDKIPIISTLRSVYKISHSISDYLFIQKLLKFLYELRSLSEQEKIEMKLKMESNNKYQNKIGEKLLEIVNKIDDSDKTVTIAKIFKSYINGDIEIHEFMKFCQIVNKSYLPDLMKLTNFARGQSLRSEYSGSLLSMGLLQINPTLYTREIKLGLSEIDLYQYILNSDGKKLLMILYPEFELL